MSAEIKLLIANVYNPHNLPKEELVAAFVVRKKVFENIFRDIESSTMQRPEQHYLIQGVRGMGKTTLLLRLAYEAEDHPLLHTWLVPVVFHEEEYGIGSLADVWEKVAEYLEEKSPDFAGLYEKMVTQYGAKDYEQKAIATLQKALQEKQKKLLLLVDNLGDILNKLDEKEEHRLREVLLTIPEIRLVGATSVVLEQFFDYKKPFYDFFRTIYLEGLSREETNDLLLKLAAVFQHPEVKQIVETQPGRIETLRQLTGGVLRTMILLFEIFAESNTGSAFKDLEILVDRVTPLYKHRMDDLPPQQQKIVAALATFWESASAKEIAKEVRLESKVVSAQLNQLIKNRIIEKVETTTKNHLYRLEERFFNIWYLMRFGKKSDKRILWLVKFLEEFMGNDVQLLMDRIERHVQAMQQATMDTKAAVMLSNAFAHLLKDKEKQDLLLKRTKEYILKNNPELVSDILISDKDLLSEIYLLIKNGRYESALSVAKSLKIHDVKYLVADIQALKELDEEKYSLTETQIINTAFLFFKEKMYHKALEYMNVLEERKGFSMQDNKEPTMGLLSWLFVSESDNLSEADIKIIEDAFSYNSSDLETFLIFLVSNATHQNAIKLFSRLIEKAKPEQQKSIFLLLLAQGYYHIAYNYIQSQGLLTPWYYAALYYLQEEYPNEYLRMPVELKELVEVIIGSVEVLKGHLHTK